MNRTILFAATLLIAGAASADQFRFSYSERDFSSPEAVAALHERIEQSARSYCGKQYSKTKHLSQYGSCVEDVVSEMTDGIDAGRRYASASDKSNRDS